MQSSAPSIRSGRMEDPIDSLRSDMLRRIDGKLRDRGFDVVLAMSAFSLRRFERRGSKMLGDVESATDIYFSSGAGDNGSTFCRVPISKQGEANHRLVKGPFPVIAYEYHVGQ